MNDPAAQPVTRARDSILRDPVLARGTLLTHDMDRLVVFCTEALGLDVVRVAPDRAAIHDQFTGRDGRTFWSLDVTEVEKIAVPQMTLNHWGVTVGTNEEVNQAYRRIVDNKERFGVKSVQKPRMQHQSYSFYTADIDSNWWEVECREFDVQYEQLTDMHWLKANTK